MNRHAIVQRADHRLVMEWAETAMGRGCACSTGARCPETTHAWYRRERHHVRTSVSLAHLGPVTVWLNVPIEIVAAYEAALTNHSTLDARHELRGVNVHRYRFHPTDDDCTFLIAWIARCNQVSP